MALAKTNAALDRAMDGMESYLLYYDMLSKTKTADELTIRLAKEKLTGRPLTAGYEEKARNEILKRRRNEVPRNGSVASLATERVPAASAEGSECLEADRP